MDSNMHLFEDKLEFNTSYNHMLLYLCKYSCITTYKLSKSKHVIQTYLCTYITKVKGIINNAEFRLVVYLEASQKQYGVDGIIGNILSHELGNRFLKIHCYVKYFVYMIYYNKRPLKARNYIIILNIYVHFISDSLNPKYFNSVRGKKVQSL